MNDSPVKIIQLSDMHLFANTKNILLGVNTQESFEAVIELLKKEARNIDLILLTGDLSQDSSVAAYKRIADDLKLFNVPVYCVPGNHDDPHVMAQVYPRETISIHRHLILKNWQLILLNSHKANAVEGYLEQSELNYLQHCLQTYPEHEALVVFHHQPIPVGVQWLDKLGMTNAADLWEVLLRYPKVHTLLFGHVHQEYEQIHHRIRCYATPSTCFQFKPNQDNFGLEHVPPGYRWIHLFTDGHLETGTRRVAEYIGFFDKHAKGY